MPACFDHETKNRSTGDYGALRRRAVRFVEVAGSADTCRDRRSGRRLTDDGPLLGKGGGGFGSDRLGRHPEGDSLHGAVRYGARPRGAMPVDSPIADDPREQRHCKHRQFRRRAQWGRTLRRGWGRRRIQASRYGGDDAEVRTMEVANSDEKDVARQIQDQDPAARGSQ